MQLDVDSRIWVGVDAQLPENWKPVDEPLDGIVGSLFARAQYKTYVGSAPPMDHWVCLTFVTPEDASDLLGLTAGNRKVTPFRVRPYSEEMLRGNWAAVPIDPILIGRTGLLTNGHHRLESLKSLRGHLDGNWFWINYGLPTELRKYIDGGKARNAADVGRLAGMDITADDVAVVNAMFYAGSGNRRSMVNSATLGEFSANYDAVKFAAEVCRNQHTKPFKASVRAVFARAYYTADREKVRRFASIMFEQDYDHSKPWEKNAWLLLNAANNSKGDQGSERQKLYQKTEYALRTFLEQRPIERLLSEKYEIFVTPGD